MLIRTKIIATIGPASTSPEVLREMALAGADIFRVNFSHGTPEEHLAALRSVRQVEQDLRRPLGVLADLCGPKIRVGAMQESGGQLVDGQSLIIRREPLVGNRECISTTLGEIVDQVRVGETLLLDDGKLRLQVTETGARDHVVTRVLRGGWLSSGKGINLPETDLDLPALTEKDRADVAWIAAHDFDYVALSFVCRPGDIDDLRALIARHGATLPVIAKIEKPQALKQLEAIVAAADAVMVARGDLGVEMDLPRVPVAQKNIARECALQAKPCIIATQMLESMTVNSVPTRAEVSDVANAVLDHADAVMLSGETAVGRHPVAAVAMMNDIVGAIQDHHDRTFAELKITPRCIPPTLAALAESVHHFIAREPIAAIAVFTITGTTARVFAKHRPACPILGLSPDRAVLRRMCLYYGVWGLHTPMLQQADRIMDTAAQFARQMQMAVSGDKLLVIAGQPVGIAGLTNTMVVHTV